MDGARTMQETIENLLQTHSHGIFLTALQLAGNVRAAEGLLRRVVEHAVDHAPDLAVHPRPRLWLCEAMYLLHQP